LDSKCALDHDDDSDDGDDDYDDDCSGGDDDESNNEIRMEKRFASSRCLAMEHVRSFAGMFQHIEGHR